MNEAASQNWSSRALERQIGTLYYERLLSSQDKAAVVAEASAKTAGLTPRDIVRDPVVLEFLGFPNAGAVLENDLEQALIDQLQGFLLELGKGFAFVARQQRISTESKDFYLDLVFYNYLLKRFVIFDLKLRNVEFALVSANHQCSNCEALSSTVATGRWITLIQFSCLLSPSSSPASAPTPRLRGTIRFPSASRFGSSGPTRSPAIGTASSRR